MPKRVRACMVLRPSLTLQSIRTTRGAKRVYAAPYNAGYEIFCERGVWKAAGKFPRQVSTAPRNAVQNRACFQ